MTALGKKDDHVMILSEQLLYPGKNSRNFLSDEVTFWDYIIDSGKFTTKESRKARTQVACCLHRSIWKN